MVKRSFDLCFSLLVLLPLVPLLIVVGVLVWLTSDGPVIFRQERMGSGGRPFAIWKFRTMTHAARGSEYTLGADPRITRVGAFLRRWKVDELPQLWNVLRGEMSIVGPRPVLPALTREFPDGYARLLTVRPGLTDPASLKYSQEARLLQSAPNPLHYFKTVVTPEKIAISADYLERANLWTDIATIAATVVICVFPEASHWYAATFRVWAPEGSSDVM